MEALVRTFLNPAASMTISLERLTASVKKPAPPPVTAVKNDPPTIFISFKPAIILLVNGQPVLAPIPNSNLKAVVNANWPLFQDESTSTYFLFNSKGWMTAVSLGGPWAPTAQLPKGMSGVAASPNWQDLKPYIAAPAIPAVSPQVFYSSTPAEIVVFQGQPQWSAIPGTQLVYATNTGSPVFKYTPTGTYYYLTSGRWFSASRPLGPWTFATDSLPPDFKNIPPSSPIGGVLASVPGTPEAEDAVLIAQIPTTATVNAAEAAKQVKVSYSGPPKFEPITGTSLSYAVNTPDRVIQVGDLYYLCFQGVWFMSTTPNGPWQTAQSVPQVIYTIPPSSPVYNVTYVTQVPASNGYVTSSYTAGYLGAFVAGAAVGAIIADGTGYYYPPYVGFYGAYPAYYPYATTYGYHAYANPYTGAYGYGASAYGPYGGQAHWGAAYNPSTGTYARGATASTPYGSQSVAQAYNPYTGAYGQTHQGSNAYGSWGSSTVTKNGETAYSQHESGAYGSEGTVQTTAGGKAAATSTAYGNTAAGKTSSGDMYADHNGNVYKNTGSGWQSYNNGSWNNVNKPTTSSAQSYSQEHPTSNSAQSYSQEHPSGTSSASSYDKSGAGSSSGWGEAQKDAQSRASGEASSQRYSQAQHSGWGGDSAARSGGWGGRRRSLGRRRWRRSFGGGGFRR